MLDIVEIAAVAAVGSDERQKSVVRLQRDFDFTQAVLVSQFHAAEPQLTVDKDPHVGGELRIKSGRRLIGYGRLESDGALAGRCGIDGCQIERDAHIGMKQ